MKFLCLLVAFATSVLARSIERRAAPSASLIYGTVTGATVDGIDSFLGIPYAQPPVGNLRLRQSLPINSSFGTFSATGSPRACPQFSISTSGIPLGLLGYLLDTPLLQDISNQGEDCLTISIQRPAGTAPNAKLPVVFWIYGGAFENGATTSYNGTSLVLSSVAYNSPMIFVEINYRLGGFGFLGGKEALAANATNLGLLDQRLALQWVADNIAAFGGDPTKVTIWGESAGAESVFYQMFLYNGTNTYKGKSLFRGAIMNSGSINPSQPVDGSIAQADYNQVVSAAGCSSATDTFSCLRTAPYTTFLNAANSLPDIYSYSSGALSYRPRPDYNAIATTAQNQLAAGQYAKVPFITGNQQEEGTLSALFTSNVSNSAGIVQLLETYYPFANSSYLTSLVATYPDTPAAGAPYNTGTSNQLYPEYKRIASILGDVTQLFDRRFFLEGVGSAVPSWSFIANYSTLSTPYLGTFHSSDIAYEFGQTTGFPMTTIQGYYISFITQQNPNTLVSSNSQFPNWPEWNSGAGHQLINFGATINSVISDTFRNSSYQIFRSNISAWTF